MCLYPNLILNRRYVPNKKNKGVPPVCYDPRTKYVPIGCGNCFECMRKKTNNWRVRLAEEVKFNPVAKFVNLSFSEESLTKLGIDILESEDKIKKVFNSYYGTVDGYLLDNQIATLAMRRFLERWRKKYSKSVRHWFVTELGKKNTERIHLHGLMWTDVDNDTIAKLWKYGNVYIGHSVNQRTVNYIVKYLHKTDLLHPHYKPITLTSHGIGASYINSKAAELNAFDHERTNELYYDRSGRKYNLPIYYRNKIYSEDERQALWIYQLDKNTRFVDGIEIDVSNGYELYYKALEEARKKNIRLGFGNDTVDWDKKTYESHLRALKNMGRLGLTL